MGYPFNKLPFGVYDKYITTIVEVPKGSMLKIEWDRHGEYFVLDRVEPGIFSKPVNYGFIPQTLDEDGDPLDTLLVTDEPVPTGVVVPKAIVIGMVDFEDDGENDHKIICVPKDDYHLGQIRSFEELGPQWHKQIEHHFNNYKTLRKGETKVRSFKGVKEAWKVINECVERAKIDEQ